MTMHLRQSTASQSVLIGPFVNDADGNTAETGLTIANTDIRLSKNGGNIAAKNSGGGTHDELGYYTITLDATDTNTVGRLQLMVHASGALPVYHEFEVLEEAAYDAIYASSAAPATAANQANIEADTQDIQARLPAALVSGRIDASVGAMANNVMTAAAAASDLTTELQSGLATASALSTVDGKVDTLTTYVDTEVAAIKAKTDNLPSDPADASVVAGLIAAVDAKIDTIDSNVDAVLEDTGTTLPGTLFTIAGYIDTEVAAIKAKTDQLTFTTSNRVDASMRDLSGNATAAANMAKAGAAICRGTVAAAATETSIPTSAFSPSGAATDQFKGRIITFDADTPTAALRGQSTAIEDSTNAATPTFTVTALTTAPASGDTFSVT